MTDLTPVDDTQRAVDALAHRLRGWGVAEPEAKASEFVTALRSQGWRPTEARSAASWRPSRSCGSPANELWRRVKEDITARRHGAESADREDRVVVPNAQETS